MKIKNDIKIKNTNKNLILDLLSKDEIREIKNNKLIYNRPSHNKYYSIMIDNNIIGYLLTSNTTMLFISDFEELENIRFNLIETFEDMFSDLNYSIYLVVDINNKITKNILNPKYNIENLYDIRIKYSRYDDYGNLGIIENSLSNEIIIYSYIENNVFYIINSIKQDNILWITSNKPLNVNFYEKYFSDEELSKNYLIINIQILNYLKMNNYLLIANDISNLSPSMKFKHINDNLYIYKDDIVCGINYPENDLRFVYNDIKKELLPFLYAGGCLENDIIKISNSNFLDISSGDNYKFIKNKEYCDFILKEFTIRLFDLKNNRFYIKIIFDKNN